MRKYLFFLATTMLMLPISAWTRQSTAQGQQASDSAASKSETQATTQATTPDSKKTDADQQSPSSSANKAPQDPLAEAARRAREQKKEAPKPKKVFTNDDIPTSGGISTASKAGDKGAASDASASDKSTADDEKTWRDKFAALRHKLEQDQAALSVMQRELGELNVQFYGDPAKAMQQQYTRSDINNKTAEIEAKKKDIEADQQAISDAEDALRKAGGEPGWAR